MRSILLIDMDLIHVDFNACFPYELSLLFNIILHFDSPIDLKMGCKSSIVLAFSIVCLNSLKKNFLLVEWSSSAKLIFWESNQNQFEKKSKKKNQNRRVRSKSLFHNDSTTPNTTIMVKSTINLTTPIYFDTAGTVMSEVKSALFQNCFIWKIKVIFKSQIDTSVTSPLQI